MIKFYISSCITLLLYGWFFISSNKTNRDTHYFENLTNKRTLMVDCISMIDSALFLVKDLHIEAPNEFYQLKYKDLPSDSLLVYTLPKSRWNIPNSLLYKCNNHKLSIQLNPSLKNEYVPKYSDLVNNGQQQRGFMFVILATKSLPDNIHLSPFTTLDVDYPQRVNKLTIHLEEGAEMIIRGLQIDTLQIISKCNSLINLGNCTINYLSHQLNGGSINSDQTEIGTYYINRTTQTYCNANAYVNVTKEINGDVLTNVVTLVEYESNPLININSNNNLKISPRSTLLKTVRNSEKYNADLHNEIKKRAYGIR
jgi:hypothetical protein